MSQRDICDRCNGFIKGSHYHFRPPYDSKSNFNKPMDLCLACVEGTEDGKRLLYAIKKMQIFNDTLREIAK